MIIWSYGYRLQIKTIAIGFHSANTQLGSISTRVMLFIYYTDKFRIHISLSLSVNSKTNTVTYSKLYCKP